MNDEHIKQELVQTAHRLYRNNLVRGKAGNISARAEDGFWISGSGVCLGELQPEDFAKIDLSGVQIGGEIKASSELPSHLNIYQLLPAACVVHIHPPLALGYFSQRRSLTPLTFEENLYLGEVTPLDFDTPLVFDPKPLLQVLSYANIAFVRNHGAFIIEQNLNDAFHLADLLEQAVRVQLAASVAQIKADVCLGKSSPSPPAARERLLDSGHLKELCRKSGGAVWQEEEFTGILRLEVDDPPTAATFRFAAGAAKLIEENDKTPDYVISGPFTVWQAVFCGWANPLTLIVQKRLRLTGDFQSLLQHYSFLCRLFAFWAD